MKVSLYSSLQYERIIINDWEYERFFNNDTGYESLWNPHTATDPNYNIPGHTGIRIQTGDHSKQLPNVFALANLKKFVPPETVPFTPLSNDEIHDNYPSTHTTGPGNRRYTAPALRYALSSDPMKVAAGVAALTSFSNDEKNRPLSHLAPFDVREDLSINKGTPDAWTCDMKTATGWNAWDPAHACLANEFAGAVLGIDECLEAFLMQYRILAKGFDPATTSFWFNQQRAAAWSIICEWAASWLGFTKDVADAMFNGRQPKTGLRGRLHRICITEPYDPLVSGPADNRVMPVIGDFQFGGKDYGMQCHGEYMWQKGLRTSALGLVLSDGMLDDNSPERYAAHKYAVRSITDMMQMFDPKLGISWVANYTEMPQDAANDLLAKVTAAKVGVKGARPCEVMINPSSGLYRVIEIPIAQDCALHLLGWLCMSKTHNGVADQLFGLVPKPGEQHYEPTVQDCSVALYMALPQ